jgi:hypothetical protein
MRILLVSDGSEDGLDALEIVASLRGEAGPNPVVTFVVGWPPRDGPLWRAVYERQFVDDDLHRALAETVERVTHRLQRIAGELAREVESRVQDGDAAEQLAAAVTRERIDIVIAGVTGGAGHRPVQKVLEEVMARIGVPLVAVYGTAR